MNSRSKDYRNAYFLLQTMAIPVMVNTVMVECRQYSGVIKKILMYEICEQNPVAKSQLINLIET